ncbi:MAG: hypothetical protein DBX59_09235 [Bacillota bacterium]|nr:MAG: hypothetical protein DBX59_09235 [Bacillota bacterium]
MFHILSYFPAPPFIPPPHPYISRGRRINYTVYRRGDIIKRLYKTAAVVTLFSVAEKFLGFTYRIFLSRTIGSEGVGLYQISLSVFAVLLTLACSGIPITVSRLMTKYKALNQPKKEKSVVTAGLLLAVVLSLPLLLCFLFGSGRFGFLFTDERCMSVFLIVLPALTFNCVYAVIRGAFWGNKDFLPYSIIELLEEIVMIFLGVILITGATSVFDGAKRAAYAVLGSYLFSFAAGTVVFFLRGGRLANPKKEFFPLLASVMPITAMRTANSFVSSLISIILPLRLVAAGMTNSEALSLFGSAFGMAMPLLSVPNTFLGSFILVLVPEISENYYKNDMKSLQANFEKAMKLSVFVSCVFIPLYLVLGEEIGVLVYRDAQSGKYLSSAAFLMLFMGISALTTSVLNSVGMEKRSLLYFLAGAAIMLLCIWFLPAVMGAHALIAGFAAVFALTSVLNLRLLHKKCRVKANYLKFVLLGTLFLIPTSAVGFLLENLLIGYLGNLLSLIVIGGVMVVFNVLLFAVFNLVDLSSFRLPLFKKSKKAS